MEFPPCYTYHSVYPKYQVGTYEKFFELQANPENAFFIENPQDQKNCRGTEIICYDTTFGKTPCAGQSQRSQAIRNQKLRNIIKTRPMTSYDGHSYNKNGKNGNGNQTNGAKNGNGAQNSPTVRPWWL